MTNTGRILSFQVIGVPAPQGSKRYVGNGIMVDACTHLRPWRQDVRHAAILAINDLQDGAWRPLDGPVDIRVDFYFPRPRAHFSSSGAIKPKAPPIWVPNRTDIDKLARAILDSLTGLVYVDDRQVASLSLRKMYASGVDAVHTTIISVDTLRGRPIEDDRPELF